MEAKSKIKAGGGALTKKPPTQRDVAINEERTSQVQSDPVFLRYCNWLLANGCVSPSLTFPVAFWESGEIGALAKSPIPPNKAFIFVPYSLCITASVAKNSEIGHIFESYPYWYSGHSGAVDYIIWTFMVFERIKGPNSFWYPYFETVKEFELLMNWSKAELSELHDPVLVFDTKAWEKRMEKTWTCLEEVFRENPHIFIPSAPLKEYFEWAWKLTSTRSFSHDGGMVIPFGDHVNHGNVSVEFETHRKDELLEIATAGGPIDYSDFTGNASLTTGSMPKSTNKNRLEKYLATKPDKGQIKKVQNLWELEGLIRDFQSDSDNESVRNFGDVGSEDDADEDEEEEEIKHVEELTDLYFVVRTAKKTGFAQGSQALIMYGRLSNRELLLDYGFTIPDNKYNAFYFRMWKATSGRTGLLSSLDFTTEEYKEELAAASLDDLTEFFSLKLKRINTDIFTYFRKACTHEEISAHSLQKPPLSASPYNIEFELYIIEKVINLYMCIVGNFKTTLQHDMKLRSQKHPPRMESALAYRIGQKTIVNKQIEYVYTLKRILQSENAIDQHFKGNSVKEISEVYPLLKYLRSLKANLMYG